MQQETREGLDRKIIISSIIDEELSEQVIAKIIDINDFDSKMSVMSTYRPEPIEIFINSVGGNVSDGFAIIGAMEMSETPIITYGLGIVASMALAIFVAGDVRVSARHTRYMYHSISYGMFGYIQDHEDAQVETDLLQRMFNSLILDRTKLTREKLEESKAMKKDFFFSSKEALKLGVVDTILKKPEKKTFSKEEIEELEKELDKNKD